MKPWDGKNVCAASGGFVVTHEADPTFDKIAPTFFLDGEPYVQMRLCCKCGSMYADRPQAGAGKARPFRSSFKLSDQE